MQKCAVTGVLLAVLLSAAVPSFGQGAPALFDVIVVFAETAPDLTGPGRSDRAPGQTNRPGSDSDVSAYLSPEVTALVNAYETRLGFRAQHVYSAALRGFAARLSAPQIVELESDPAVAYVEADGDVTADAQTLPWGINRIGAPQSSAAAGDGQGLVRGVNVYVIDTGVNAHPDLNRVSHVNFAKGKNDDCNGHGTHVAGTIAARDNDFGVVGVAPGASVTGVKVLGCDGSGTTSAVIKGIDWVTANAAFPAVANMSLGGSLSQALDDAVRRSAAKGIFYGLAAGNSAADACGTSPARVGAGAANGIMTVAAVGQGDVEASWSNFGRCVDTWAPGVSIASTYTSGGYATLSGTSMAAPHMTGAAALYLSQNGAASPVDVEIALTNAAVATGTVSKDGAAISVPVVSGF